MELRLHPDGPSPSYSVTAAIARNAAKIGLQFGLHGDVTQLKIPAPSAPARTDGLWRHTCFEMFVKPAGGDEYFEFNFSPSTEWAAYSFTGYREGMADLPIPAPAIGPAENGIGVAIDLSDLPDGPWFIALSAVIEQTDGTKSYWALRHPPGKPDFHHPDCFALQLPASSAA